MKNYIYPHYVIFIVQRHNLVRVIFCWFCMFFQSLFPTTVYLLAQFSHLHWAEQRKFEFLHLHRRFMHVPWHPHEMSSKHESGAVAADIKIGCSSSFTNFQPESSGSDISGKFMCACLHIDDLQWARLM